MLEQIKLGFCIWDVLALIILIIMIAIFIAHRHNQKKREDEFEKQLAEKLAEDVVKNETV